MLGLGCGGWRRPGGRWLVGVLGGVEEMIGGLTETAATKAKKRVVNCILRMF